MTIQAEFFKSRKSGPEGSKLKSQNYISRQLKNWAHNIVGKKQIFLTGLPLFPHHVCFKMRAKLSTLELGNKFVIFLSFFVVNMRHS